MTAPVTAAIEGFRALQGVPGHPRAAPRPSHQRHRRSHYGAVFSSRVHALGIHEVKIAPRAPWQTPYVERLIGTLRRECLDHMVVLKENHLCRRLRDYLIYYHRARTHLSLDKDAPEPRLVEHPDQGGIVEIPMVGGLHHRYTRQAA
jgi:putative transposase